MKSIIIFDSAYGNTKVIAEEMSKAIYARLLYVGSTEYTDIIGTELLIIGSPTQGGKPTKAIQKFIDKAPAGTFKGISFAAFDTRFEEKKQNLALKTLMKTIGYAADKISKSLVKDGGLEITSPEGFIVKSKKGPLKDGETARAKTWAKKLAV
jgi:flavodoxin I